MDRNPHLKVVEGSLGGKSFEVTEDGLKLGRGDACEVRLPDPGVSREHARVFLHNAGVWVQDLGSRNGVFVKGKRILRPKQLSPGTEFTVGDHRFTVEVDSEPATEEVASPVVTITEGPTQVTPVHGAAEPTVSVQPPGGSGRLVLGLAIGLLVLGMIAVALLSG